MRKKSLCLFFTVLFYGQAYETEEIDENMDKNPKVKSSPP